MAKEGFSEVVAAGERRDSLVALRDLIAAEIEAGVPAKDLASLSQRLMDVLLQLDSVPNPEKVSAADEVAQRRAARRRAGPASTPRAPRSG